jgi:hypothetical protein
MKVFQFFLTVGIVLILTGISFSQSKALLFREAAEFVMKKFGKEATDIGLNTIIKKMEILTTKYGDDAVVAVRKVGPRAFHLVEEAGEHGLESVKLMAKFGDDSVWIISKKNRLSIFIKYGDDAAESMIKHKEIAETLLNSFGKSSASALKSVSSQNGRRLAMMAEDGALKKIGKSDELLETIGKYGDKAMNFIWVNKGALAVSTTLTAFLLNPEPFLDNTIGKFGDIPGQIANEAAKKMNWTLVIISSAGIIGILICIKIWLNHRILAQKLPPQP